MKINQVSNFISVKLALNFELAKNPIRGERISHWISSLVINVLQSGLGVKQDVPKWVSLNYYYLELFGEKKFHGQSSLGNHIK